MQVPATINKVENRDSGSEENQSLPVFLKAAHSKILVVGGGLMAGAVVRTIVGISHQTSIEVVWPEISSDLLALASEHSSVTVLEHPLEPGNILNAHLAFVAIEEKDASLSVYEQLKEAGVLVNVANAPELSDFDLGPVVQRGDIKIAISANGHSKTLAGRVGEMIQYMLPNGIEEVLQQAKKSTSGNNTNLYGRLKQLNNLSKVLMAKQLHLNDQAKPDERRWQKVVKWCLFAFFFMLLGHGLLSLVPNTGLLEGIRSIPHFINSRSFLIMVITGFLAQMVDGSLGMGYGTISTTFLLAMGVSPAIVSSRVHSARVFSSGVSGYSHHRFGNINRKLFAALVIPGVLGAVIGAVMAYFGQKYSSYIRIPLSIYTIYLGYYIVKKAFRKQRSLDKVRSAGWLASAGGFMDAFAGGGWGTLVTSTLIAKRRSPRYVIGSVCLAEFFVVLASSITFFILLQSIPIGDVIGLVIGGLLAAPIAARMVGKLPLKTTFIIVGAFVILTSVNTLWKAIVHL